MNAVPDAGRANEWAAAQARYENELLPDLLDTAKGRILVLDVPSGDYEVDADLIAATERLKARRPGAFVYAFRIGHPAVAILRGRIKAVAQSDSLRHSRH